MLTFIPFQARHLGYINVQGAQAEFRRWAAQPDYVAALEHNGVALTALGAEGGNPVRVAGCAGLLHQWRGRAKAWALIGEVQPREWRQIARRMGEIIAAAQAGGVWRIEGEARAGFAQGCRLFDLLGFAREGVMRKWSPDGADMILYAKVR